MKQTALKMLHRELKKAKISLSHAKARPGAKVEETVNLSKKIETLDWLIGVVQNMEKEAEE